jgi:DNA-binding MarR family transcriptional regulator
VLFNHDLGTPLEAQANHRLNALKVVARFEQARTIDIAAALFPDRGFKAALSAAQRTVKGLRAAKYVTKYLSDSRRVYYALSTKGARLLRDHAYEGGDGTAQATARRVCEKTNPEHALWSAFYTIACQARGLPAWSERELRPRYWRADRAGGTPIRTFPLNYTGSDGKNKGLMPDAMATFVDGDQGVIWFEIDRSARGSARLDDLVALVKKLGTKVDVGDGQASVLRKVIILCKTTSILRRNRTLLLGRSVTSDRLNSNTNELALIEREQGCLDSYRCVEVRLGKRVRDELKVVGQIHLQLLPMHLSSYSYKDGAARGWFDDGSLPFREPDAAWPAPIPIDQS